MAVSLIKITKETKEKIKEEVGTVIVLFVFFEVLSLIAAVIVCGISWLHRLGKDTYSIFKIAPIIAVAFTVIFYAATKLFSGSDGYGSGRKRPRIPIKGGWY
jgi:hypothetical protein